MCSFISSSPQDASSAIQKMLLREFSIRELKIFSAGRWLDRHVGKLIQKPMDFGDTRPGKRLHKTMERSTIFHGKIHYFDWAIFNSHFHWFFGT